MGALDWEQQLDLKAKQGRPHMFLDMRIVNDAGKELPHDGKASGNLEVEHHAALGHVFACSELLCCKSLIPEQHRWQVAWLQVRGPIAVQRYFKVRREIIEHVAILACSKCAAAG